MQKIRIPLYLSEHSGIVRRNEPVTVGLPMPVGAVHNPRQVSLSDSNGMPVTVQVDIAARWPDASAQWVHLSFCADSAACAVAQWWVAVSDQEIEPIGGSLSAKLHIEKRLDLISVDTGCVKVYIDTRYLLPFSQVILGEQELIGLAHSSTKMRGTAGRFFKPVITDARIEHGGTVRAVIACSGYFEDNQSCRQGEFIGRLAFYAGSPLVKFDLTVRNPKPAVHPQNLWDLGDSGSLFFTDLSTTLALKQMPVSPCIWYAGPHGKRQTGYAEIYQDSSGGKNWRSPNHINKDGVIPLSFCGYRVFDNSSNVRESGLRAQPAVALCRDDMQIGAMVQDFWQNFPKSLKVSDTALSIGFFPERFNDVFELQGGEQKTHTVFFAFQQSGNVLDSLSAASDPLHVHAPAEWYCGSGVFPCLLPYTAEPPGRCAELVDSIVEGDDTFFDRREIIDEYGWRHFGELYADHEAVTHSGSEPFISHYNNQYDVVCGMIKQYVRTTDRRWYELASSLARHVADIDVYHTDGDKYDYNHGLFWHTDHYTPAATCTHRTYSLKNKTAKKLAQYGGGPSLSHNYTSGLLLYYYLTGCETAKESFLEMISWTKNSVIGPASYILVAKRCIKWCINMYKDLKGRGKAQRPYLLDGPGRASGNTLNALLDGYACNGDTECLELADRIISRCISPRDAIGKRDLLNAEMRWMYLVFLAALIKYMHLKELNNAFDTMYQYAKESLLHYARWMSIHEYPYLRKPEILEYPNETWGAQDMRKSAIFDYAAHYTGSAEEKKLFLERADFFYASSLDDVVSFKTARLTRPLALLMMYGHIHQAFDRNKSIQENKPHNE